MIGGTQYLEFLYREKGNLTKVLIIPFRNRFFDDYHTALLII